MTRIKKSGVLTLSVNRYNKELVCIYNKEVDLHISPKFLCETIKREMANFVKCGAGNCFDEISLSIADIDAEFIRLPKKEATKWAKSLAISFLSSTSLHEAPGPGYMIICYPEFGTINQVVLPEEVFSLFISSLSSHMLYEIAEQEPLFCEKVVSGKSNNRYLNLNF